MPFGSGGTARGGSSNTIVNVLEEGSELLVELQNVSSKSIDIGFKVQIEEIYFKG